MVDNDFVKSNFLEDTRYIIEYDVTLNEEIPEGFEVYAQGSQWGHLRYRTGISGSYTYGTHSLLENELHYYDYVVGEKYHRKESILMPNDLSTTVLIFYTARAVDENNNGYILNGTFSNIAFYKADTPHTLDYIFEYRDVTSSTTVGIYSSHTLTAKWVKNNNQ